jgi:hypothetical protein
MWNSYVFKLSGIGALYVDKWRVGINDSIFHQVSHLYSVRLITFLVLGGFIWAYPEMIMLDSQALKISTTENNGSKVLIDALEERLGRGEMRMSS